jgi:DNA polymerase-3 subunit chi
VTEVFFYHLQRQPLEAVLPSLLAKALARGWRAVVQATSEERLSALDDQLWTYSDDSFLPHGSDREPHAADQPVLLTLGSGNPNDAKIRFLVDGSDLPADSGSYDRMMILFDGTDPDAVARARAQWTRVKAEGYAATYWQQGEGGGWERKA